MLPWWGTNGADSSIYVTLNLQINGKENVRGQPEEAQGEVRELHQTGELLDLCHLLCLRNVGKNLVSLSIVNVSIDPLLTVQQETEWWRRQLTPGDGWGQWTGNICSLTNLIYERLIWQKRPSSGCLLKGHCTYFVHQKCGLFAPFRLWKPAV